MRLSLQEGIWRVAATLTLTNFVGWGLKMRTRYLRGLRENVSPVSVMPVPEYQINFVFLHYENIEAVMEL